MRAPVSGEQVLARAVVGKTLRVWPSVIRDYTSEIYQARSRRSVAFALGAALAIHAIVVVIAGLESEPPPAAEALFSEQIAEVVFESGPPEPIPPQQTEEEPLVAEAPPPTTETPEFSKKRQRRRRIAGALAPPRRSRDPAQWDFRGCLVFNVIGKSSGDQRPSS